MKKSDLREGNIINREDLVSRELRIEKIIHLAEKATATGPIKVICSYEDLIPIKLTEDWLKDFDFEILLIPGKDLCYFVKDELMIQESTFEVFFKDDSNRIDIELKYVHQLQNLYFALKEKELKLKS